MSALRIELPDDLLLTIGQTRDEFLREATFLLALKMFETGRISSGQAAERERCGEDPRPPGCRPLRLPAHGNRATDSSADSTG